MTELRIKELAKQQGLTMAQLAKRLGINPSSLSQALARNRFDMDYLERIAEALGVEVADLFVRNKTAITCPYCGKVITIKTED